MSGVVLTAAELDYLVAKMGGEGSSLIRPSADGLTGQDAIALVAKLELARDVALSQSDGDLWRETVTAVHGLKMRYGLHAAKAVVTAHGPDLKTIGATEDRDLWTRLRDAARQAFDRIETAEEIMEKT